jgi:hypothetical protein
MQVSTDEMNSWFHKKWLSFDPSATTEYSERERVEVRFVRGLARSGLSDAMISRVLSAGLQRPYCYDSDTTFFSFVQDRWISLPPERDPADVTAEYIDELAGTEDWDTLRELQTRITVALEGAVSGGADVSERYQFGAKDHDLLSAAEALLRKVLVAESTRPAELVSVAKLQLVLSRLPRVTSGMDVKVSVASPRRNCGEIETFHWWEVAVEGERLSISSGGHFYRPSTGGDSFSTMSWVAIPEVPTELDDHRESLWMVPDAQSFPDGVAGINFEAGGYTVEVTDEDNPRLEDDDSDDEEDVGNETDVEPNEEEDEQQEGNGDTLRTWSVAPIDASEERLVFNVDPTEVDTNEPGHAYGVQNCGSCGCALNERGLFVDGRLRGDLMRGNMCAPCFTKLGEGIGWGKGQLYARQSDGSWRMVAGWRSPDEPGDGGDEGMSGEDEPNVQQTLGSSEHKPRSPIELYRPNEMIEADQQDWHMALLIFQEMGWQPARPLEACAHPLTFIKHDEGEAMQRAGRSLFALIQREPFVSTSVQMDLGLFYQLTEFVGGGAFIVGRPGSYEQAKRDF